MEIVGAAVAGFVAGVLYLPAIARKDTIMMVVVLAALGVVVFLSVPIRA